MSKISEKVCPPCISDYCQQRRILGISTECVVLYIGAARGKGSAEEQIPPKAEQNNIRRDTPVLKVDISCEGE